MRQRKETDAKKVALLYLDTGGGHRAAALSLQKYLKKHSPQTETILHNPLEQHKLLKGVIEGGYRVVTDQARPLWPVLYHLNTNEWAREIVYSLSAYWFTTELQNFLVEEGVTHLAVLHYLLIRPAGIAIQDRDIQTVLYILDPFTVHPIWYHDTLLNVGCFSPQAKEVCVQGGYAPEKVNQLSFIVNPRFLKTMKPGKVKQFKVKLGLDPQKKMILIAGGGSGLKRGSLALKAALRGAPDAEIVVVCGRSDKMRRDCTALADRASSRNRIKVLGFVNFMYELINAADLVIGKAGPAFVMETLLQGKPLIIIDYMYGQEKGNVDFVLNEGFGFMETDLTGIQKRVQSILKSGATTRKKPHNKLPLSFETNSSIAFLLGNKG